MNPLISISVDAKNKAVSTITGMLTVGAKVDFSISGISSTSVPNYPSGSDFKADTPSLRLRIVDDYGRDLARFPVKKYVGTTEEGDYLSVSNNVFTNASGVLNLNTDRLRSAFLGCAFNDKLEFGIILDSIVDDAQYAVGRIKVSQWSACPTEDPTVLPDWRETLAKLSVDLTSVEASKTAAAASATAASGSASSASASASAASGYATTASSASSSASDSATSASNSATSASSSAISAATSAGNAEASVLNYPRINQSNKHWERFVNGSWVDTGVVAEGADGQDGAAATIAIGTVSTGDAGTNASVTNVGTSSAAVFNFTIPRGVDGTNGTSASATVTQTASGAVITCQTGSAEPTTATVTNGAPGSPGAPGVPASVVQVMNPVTGQWHYLYARVDSQNHVVLSLEQNGTSRDVGYIVPQGGSANQVLTKNSSTDYDVKWSSVGAGDVTGATMNGDSVTKGSNGVLAFGTVLTDASAFDAAGTASASVTAHDTDARHVVSGEKTGWNAAKVHSEITGGNPHGVTWANLSGDRPNIPSKTSDLTNDSGFLNDASAFDAAGTATGAMTTHLADTTHQHVTQSEKSGWSGKQDALEYDAQPTENSIKMVKSGGIFTWIRGLLPSWLTSSYAEPATVSSVTAKYTKPTGGIPSTDLESSVRAALTNARTPTSHASSHATGGSDAITPSSIGAMANNVTHLSGDVENLDTATCAGLKVVASDPGTYSANVIYFIKASA